MDVAAKAAATLGGMKYMAFCSRFQLVRQCGAGERSVIP